MRNEIESNEPTDIKCLLDNINRLLEAYKYLNTPIAKRSLAITLAMEALYLSLKVEIMAKRWKFQLPFKEACDVDWSYWMDRTQDMVGFFSKGDMGSVGQEPAFSVNAFFPLDLFDFYLQVANGSKEGVWYEYENVSECIEARQILEDLMYSHDYLERVDEMMNLSCQKALVDDMTKCFDPDSKNSTLREKIDKFVTAYANAHTDVCPNDKLCAIALTRLHIQVTNAYHAVDGHLEDEQFSKLYERFVLMHCSDHMQNVYNDVVSWRKTCPYNIVTKQVDKKLRGFIEHLKSNKWGDEIESFLDFDEPQRIDEANAGKFMFRNRNELTEEELNEIFELCLSCVIWYAQYLTEDEAKTLKPKQVKLPEELEQLKLLTEYFKQEGITPIINYQVGGETKIAHSFGPVYKK